MRCRGPYLWREGVTWCVHYGRQRIRDTLHGFGESHLLGSSVIVRNVDAVSKKNHDVDTIYQDS